MISDSAVGEIDESPRRTYKAHFLQPEHFNFCGLDDLMGPVVLSVKYILTVTAPPATTSG